MSDLMMTRSYSARSTAGDAGLRHWGTAFYVALRTHLTRSALPGLTDRELADIGVSRDDALAEAIRLPWDTRPSRPRRASDGVLGRVTQWLERVRTRRLLGRMQARDLHDLALSRSAAEIKASKPFWEH